MVDKMRKLALFFSMFILLVMTCSCQHKSLDELVVVLGVKYDWSQATKGPDKKMKVYLIPQSKGPIKYKSTVDGESVSEIIATDGKYTGVTFTSDVDGVIVTEEDNSVVLSTDKIADDTLPKSEDALDEPVVKSPDEIRSDSRELILDTYEDIYPSVTFIPKEIVVPVTVNMKAGSWAGSLKEMVSTISGLSGSYHYTDSGCYSSTVPSTYVVPFVASTDMFTAEFLTFGDCTQCGKNYLSTNFVFTDGSKIKSVVDVSSQVESTAPSGHIVINIDASFIDGDSFNPGMNDWGNTDNGEINLK